MAAAKNQPDQTFDLGSVRVIANSELMKNHATGMPVSAQQRMAVCEDADGLPLLFTIGTDNIFYLIKHLPGSSTGWERIDLSSAIDANKEAATFAVSQDRDGTIHLALALRSKTDASDDSLYVAPQLPNNSSDDVWSKLAGRFVQRPFAAGKMTISELLLGSNDDGQGKPLALAAVETQDGSITRAEHYFINTDVDHTSWRWNLYPIPENATHMIDMAIGTVEGDRGVYALYQTLSGPSLSFTGPSDPEFPTKRPNYGFNLPQNSAATCIAALPGQDGVNSVLYLAGSGIYAFSGSNQDATTIWSGDEIDSIHEIFAEEDTHNISLWMVAGDNALYHVRGLRDDDTKWTYPLPMRQNVAQIAALRDQKRLTSQLFVVHADSTLAYLYQDPGTTLWKESNVPLMDTGHVLEFNCYTTHLHFEDESYQPLINKPVQITASAWSFVTVNGKVHSIDPTTPATVPTDAQGNITIINKVEKLATPVLHLQADFLSQALDVNPGHKISEGLKQVKSGGDLSTAKLHNGQPLLDKSFDQGTLDSAAQSVQQLTQAGDSLPASGSSSGGHMRAMAVAPSLHLLNPAQVPVGHIWGMSFANGQAIYVEGADARALVAPTHSHGMVAMTSAEEFFADIGDFFESLWNGLKEIGHFILEKVEDGLKFIINVAGKVFHFVLKVVMEVLKVINWVLEHTLGISIEKFIEWLGFLFDWDDVKKMHKVIVNVANQTLSFAQAEAVVLEDKVSNFFEHLKEKVQALGPLPEGDQDVKSSHTQFIGQQGASSGAPSMLHSPGGNYANYQTLHGGVMTASWEMNATPSDPLTAFIDDVLAPTVDSFVHTIKKLFEDIKDAYEKSNLTFNQLLKELEVDFLVGLLDALEKLVVGLIKFVADIITLVQELINRKVDIPFIGGFVQWLYKEISDSDLTILDGFAMLIAIPVTFGFKLLTDKNPLDTDIDLSTATYQEIFGMLQGGQAASAPTPSHMRAMAVAAGAMPAAEAAPTGKESVSKGARVYSHVGGVVADIANFIVSVLTLVESVSDEKEVEDATSVLGRLKGMSTGQRISTALSLFATAFSFPVGDDKEVAVQRAVWAVRGGSSVIKPMLPAPVLGGWTMVEGLACFVMECVIFGDEMGHGTGPEKTGDIIKFFENLIGFVAELAEGATYFDAEEITKAALAAGSGAAFFIAGLLDLVRLFAIDVPNELEHMVN
jgi:hypothetical protein